MRRSFVTTPFWCLLIVAVLPFVLAGAGAYFRIQQLGSLDANHPRVQALELRGTAARAYAAQQNAWEALSLFGVAVLVAHLAGADPGTSAIAAVVFVVARLLHAVTYIADLAPARTLVFVVGLVCCITLFGSAIRA
jgi:uncharacterized MAPEG superfamily protein